MSDALREARERVDVAIERLLDTRPGMADLRKLLEEAWDAGHALAAEKHPAYPATVAIERVRLRGPCVSAILAGWQA